MKGKMRETKGITLIALVVTIVVLLILAGVSLNLVLGNNGIVSKAKDAKNKTVEAQKNTELALGELEDWMSGELGEIPSEMTLVEAFNKGLIKVGDYVDYNPQAGKSYTSVANENGWADQTYTVDESTTWRVLGLSEDGKNVLLTSGSPIKKDMNASSDNEWDQAPYLYMKGAYSYVNCEKMLNDICGIYSTSLGTARSMTIEDINRMLGVKVEGNKVYFESDPETNIDEWGVLGNTYTYTADDYTPESYINGKAHATEGETVDATAYYYDITGIRNTVIGNTTLGSLLFDKTTEDDNYVKAYWLASPGVYADSFFANFGPGYVDDYVGTGGYNFDSYGFWHAYRDAVRPVVSLNSNVTVDDIKLSSNQSVVEDPWTGYSSGFVADGDESNGEAGNNGGGGPQ